MKWEFRLRIDSISSFLLNVVFLFWYCLCFCCLVVALSIQWSSFCSISLCVVLRFSVSSFLCVLFCSKMAVPLRSVTYTASGFPSSASLAFGTHPTLFTQAAQPALVVERPTSNPQYIPLPSPPPLSGSRRSSFSGLCCLFHVSSFQSAWFLNLFSLFRIFFRVSIPSFSCFVSLSWPLCAFRLPFTQVALVEVVSLLLVMHKAFLSLFHPPIRLMATISMRRVLWVGRGTRSWLPLLLFFLSSTVWLIHLENEKRSIDKTRKHPQSTNDDGTRCKEANELCSKKAETKRGWNGEFSPWARESLE